MAYETTNINPKKIGLIQQSPNEFNLSLIYTENLRDSNSSLLTDCTDENIKVNIT
jgi:hypothetical protein